MAQRDDTNTPMLALAGFILCVLTLATIVGLQALYYNYQAAEFEEKVVNVPHLASEDLIAQQQTKLNSYAVVDEKAGVYSIPIEAAMAIVVGELREQQP